ncbi:MAG: hypothetical protein AAFR47_09650 [Pseudomonadota bacterium]
MAENTTPERIQMWRDSLDRLEAIGAGTIVPGGEGPGAACDPALFGAPRVFIDQCHRTLAETSTPKLLRAAMTDGNEDRAVDWVPDSSIGAVFPG